MNRPCETIASVNLEDRIVTLKRDVKASMFILFNKPGHCAVCRDAKKVYESDQPHTEATEG